jgi:3-oxoacyl-[acyl-carrier protein] reductase
VIVKKSVITGSSSGIGLGIARKLRKSGYSILGVQRRPPGIRADLREIAKIPEVWGDCCRKIGEVPSLVVLCAGEPMEQELIESSNESIEELILLNLISPLIFAREVIKTWKKKSIYGHLIFIGSQAALPGAKQKGNVVYTASKGGIHAMVGPLANECGPLIRINAIAPGDVITKKEDQILQNEAERRKISFSNLKREIEQTSALNRRIRVDEVAEAVLFLDRCEAMTGAIINISAGKSAH